MYSINRKMFYFNTITVKSNENNTGLKVANYDTLNKFYNLVIVIK